MLMKIVKNRGQNHLFCVLMQKLGTYLFLKIYIIAQNFLCGHLKTPTVVLQHICAYNNVI